MLKLRHECEIGTYQGGGGDVREIRGEGSSN